METLKSSGIPLLAHAEIVSQASPQPNTDPKSYQQYAASRPPQFEIDAIKLLIDLCREYRTPVHLVHLATAEALPMIRQAKQDGLPLTVETCPHYLYFSQDHVACGDTRFKCAPPIRDEANRTALCHAVAEGSIDTIGSDHSPCPPELKHLDSGDFNKAWGGIASLQLLLPATWTAGGPMDWSLSMLAERLSHRPAQILGLASQTGSIQPGFDADLVIWDPDAEFQVDAGKLLHRHAISPYDDQTLKGRVRCTYVKGQCVYDDGEFRQTDIRTNALAGYLNGLTSSAKQETLTDCCAAQRWVQQMIDHGKFTSDLDVIHCAARAWKTTEPADWLEAFEAHPRIGDVNSLRKKYASTQTTAAGEQSGCDVADEETLQQLAKRNDDYFEKFGFIFIVCATGKSAAEMLKLLKRRLTNDRSTELSIAANQQLDITMLRLRKLVK
jgi:allantoinase